VTDSVTWRSASTLGDNLIADAERLSDEEQDPLENILEDIPERKPDGTLPMPRICTTSPGLNVGKATESATSRPRKMTRP